MLNIYQEIIKKLNRSKIIDHHDLDLKIRKYAGELKIAPPEKIKLLSAYHKLLNLKTLKKNQNLENFLKKREIRTLSGVAPIAVLTKPFPCPGQCVFCPTQKNMPKSYLSNEPAVMRAILCKFDPFKQVAMRLRALKMTGHDTDKCELIIMGGTWSYLPKNYQTNFIKRCFDAFNSKVAKNLDQAQKWNEKAKFRVIGLTLETRPDYINPAEVVRMRELGATRVELGVQSLDDQVLKLNQRGHLVKETIVATKLLKDAGFKVSYHMMPNLPGATLTSDLKMFAKLFNDPDFQPDMLKIYPCVITADAKIAKWYKQGKYRPYSPKQLLELIIKIKKIIPPYVRISRLIRDIPIASIVAGNKISNLRQLIQNQEGLICRCIRCREARNKPLTINSLQLTSRRYKASQGLEYFLSYESKDKKCLYSFLRLRLPQNSEQNLMAKLPELRGAALIREVHTYGQLIPLAKTKQKAVQHLGLGKKLMLEAEKIAKQAGYQKIAVISGIGVRQYYQSLGYKLENTYLVKNL